MREGTLPMLKRLAVVAESIDLPREAITTLPEIAALIEGDAALHEAFRSLAFELATKPPSEAMAAVKQANLETRFGVARARHTYLALALSQVPAAQERHRCEGISDAMSRATLSDIGIWVRHFQAQLGMVAITVEILDWAQRYLRGALVRIGGLQFELRPFGGPIRIHQHRASGAYVLEWLATGERVDPRTGRCTGERCEATGDAFEVVLEPSTYVLDMHIPAGTRVGLTDFAHALADGRAHFAAKHPETRSVGACGEAWLLDPQLRELMPRLTSLRALQDACMLYPSTLPEEKTIRRLFGPDITRAMLPSLPRDALGILHRAVIDHLAEPTHRLEARGGAVLWPALDATLTKLAAARSHA
jgi:hypothetical protein